MHVFGEHWRRHWEKIERNWRDRVAPQDVVLVTGDVSWARHFGEALPDLEWLDRLPGFRKLIVRGNHDVWWPRTEKERSQLPPSLALLEGEALRLNGAVFCGTGGWLAPADPYFEPLDDASYRRELDALRRALQAAEELQDGQGIHVLIHFPPYDSCGKPTPFDEVLREFSVRTVTFGHFHFPEEWERAPQGEIGGIHYTLASADFIDFSPVRLPL